jgi:FkbM family methyltransferase
MGLEYRKGEDGIMLRTMDMARFKSSLSGALRSSHVIRAGFDYFPVHVELHDGKKYIVPRRVWRLIRLWQGQDSTCKESRQAFATYNGGDFLDIGAFHGWYSLMLAPKAGRADSFVSVEPDRRAFAELLFNLSVVSDLFPQLKAYPLPQPVGNGDPMVMTFPSGPDNHPQFASGREAQGGEATITVDQIVEQFRLKPTLIKVDVEGAEYFVLQGMQQTLERFHPTVMLEFHPLWQPKGVSAEDVASLLIQHGYSPETADVSSVATRQFWK